MTKARTQTMKEMLKQRIRAAWVDLCVMNAVDFDVNRILIADYGTRFEIQMPEMTEIVTEEE